MNVFLKMVVVGVNERRISVAPNGAFGQVLGCVYLGQKLPQALLGRRSAAFADASSFGHVGEAASVGLGTDTGNS